MEIEKTAIWSDVRKIFNDGPKPIRFEYRAIIHTEVEDIEIVKIVTIDNIRDYANNIGDEVMLECLIPLGDYVKRFYPYRANAELTLRRQVMMETGDLFDTNAKIETERFKLIFLPKENKQIAGSEFSMIDKATLDLMDILTLKVQLINRSLEPLRIKTTGGIFKNVSQKEVIHGLMLGESNQVLIDGKPAVDGVDIVEPDNTETQRHVIIPQGTSLSSVPTFVHERMNGVYTAGIGTYLQVFNNRRLWFVYPLFNTQRFKENVKKVIFYSVPRTRFPAVERTYRQEGDVLYIAVTSGKAYSDSGETDFMNGGSGFRLSDARAYMAKPVEVTQDGPVGKRSQLNHEVAIKDRKDDLNYAPVANEDISSNPFVQYGKVLKRSGGRIDLTWHNADPKLLYPAMPCKFVYVDDTGVQERLGLVQFVHALTQLEGQGISARGHKTACQVVLFVEQMDA